MAMLFSRHNTLTNKIIFDLFMGKACHVTIRVVLRIPLKCPGDGLFQVEKGDAILKLVVLWRHPTVAAGLLFAG